MEPLTDHASAGRAIRRYLAYAEGKLPEATFTRLEELADSPSLVDQAVNTAELLYARRDELDDTGRTLVAQLASFTATMGWHGMMTGNRGGLIAQAMRRDMGLKTEPGQARPQKAENDPEPLAQFKADAEAPASAPPVA